MRANQRSLQSLKEKVCLLLYAGELPERGVELVPESLHSILGPTKSRPGRRDLDEPGAFWRALDPESLDQRLEELLVLKFLSHP